MAVAPLHKLHATRPMRSGVVVSQWVPQNKEKGRVEMQREASSQNIDWVALVVVELLDSCA
jgi:hypothetical protein